MRKQEEGSGGAAAAAAAALPSSDEDLHGTSFSENEIQHRSLSHSVSSREEENYEQSLRKQRWEIKEITRAEREGEYDDDDDDDGKQNQGLTSFHSFGTKLGLGFKAYN